MAAERPTLTTDANVLGIVPTSVAETLVVAKSFVASTGEPFAQWISNDGLSPDHSTTPQVPKGSGGIAIAIYQLPAQGTRTTFN
jgi:hypothetical protein